MELTLSKRSTWPREVWDSNAFNPNQFLNFFFFFEMENWSAKIEENISTKEDAFNFKEKAFFFKNNVNYKFTLMMKCHFWKYWVLFKNVFKYFKKCCIGSLVQAEKIWLGWNIRILVFKNAQSWGIERLVVLKNHRRRNLPKFTKKCSASSFHSLRLVILARQKLWKEQELHFFGNFEGLLELFSYSLPDAANSLLVLDSSRWIAQKCYLYRRKYLVS